MRYTQEQKQIDMSVNMQLEDIDMYPENLHNQLRLCYAYEYFLVNMNEKGVCLIKTVPDSYFRNQFAKEVKIDRTFKSLMKKLSKKIEIIGNGVSIKDLSKKNLK